MALGNNSAPQFLLLLMLCAIKVMAETSFWQVGLRLHTASKVLSQDLPSSLCVAAHDASVLGRRVHYTLIFAGRYTMS